MDVNHDIMREGLFVSVLANSIQPMELQVKKLKSEAFLPERRSDGAAGYDLFAPLPFHISVASSMRIDLGLAIAVPEGYVGIIKSRSGLAYLENVEASNAGVIDSDYRGDVGVILRNMHLKNSKMFTRGAAIAQLIIVPVALFEVKEVDSLSETKRGTGGFGSTDRKQKSRDASPVRSYRIDSNSSEARPIRSSLHLSKRERKELDPSRLKIDEQYDLLRAFGLPREEVAAVQPLKLRSRIQQEAIKWLEEGSDKLTVFRAAIDPNYIHSNAPDMLNQAKVILKVWKIGYPEDSTKLEILQLLRDESIRRGPPELARNAAIVCVDLSMRPEIRDPEYLYY